MPLPLLLGVCCGSSAFRLEQLASNTVVEMRRFVSLEDPIVLLVQPSSVRTYSPYAEQETKRTVDGQPHSREGLL